MKKKSINNSMREKLAQMGLNLAAEDFEDAGFDAPNRSNNILQNWKTAILGAGSNAFGQLSLHQSELMCTSFRVSNMITNDTSILENYIIEQLSASSNLCVAVVKPKVKINQENVKAHKQIKAGTKKKSSQTQTTDHYVYIWGSPSSSGGSNTGFAKLPTLLPITTLRNNNSILQISCGPSHVGMITTQGQVFTWGNGEDGMLGHGTKSAVSQPKQVEKLKYLQAIQIACGAYHTAVIAVTPGTNNFVMIPQTNNINNDNGGSVTNNDVFDSYCNNRKYFTTGDLYTFGQGKAGQLGLEEHELKPNTRNAMSPTLVQFFTSNNLKVARVCCGLHHTVVIAVPNVPLLRVFSTSLYTFGYGEFGRLGHNNEDNQYLPKEVIFTEPFHATNIAAGDQHTIVSSSTSNKVFSFGSNSFGQLGISNPSLTEVSLMPARVPLPDNMYVRDVAAGGRHSCVITHCNKLLSFGWNEEGQLGHNNEKSSCFARPCKVSKVAGVQGDILTVVCGMSHTLLLVSNPTYVEELPEEKEEEEVEEEEVKLPIEPPKVIVEEVTQNTPPPVEEKVDEQPEPILIPEEDVDDDIAVFLTSKPAQKPAMLLDDDAGVDDEQLLPSSSHAPIRGIKELLLQREDRLLKAKNEYFHDDEEVQEELAITEHQQQEIEASIVEEELTLATDEQASVQQQENTARPKTGVYYKEGQDLDGCLVANSAKRAEMRRLKKK